MCFVELDFLAEGLDEGVDGTDVDEVVTVVLARALGTQEGAVLALPVQADELLGQGVVFALAWEELEVCYHLGGGGCGNVKGLRDFWEIMAN